MSDQEGRGATMSAEGQGPITSGMMIGGYRILEEIGRGGMGTVYAAVHPDIGKAVAIKVLKPELASIPEFAERFLAEARAVNRIGDEGIVDIFAFGRLAGGVPYFVMEFLEGETLGARLSRAPLSRADLVVWLGQLCKALGAAHRVGIVHRDLKPENMWLVADASGRPRVKLLDFGIAKELDAQNKLTAVGEMIGTPAYMAPEQGMGQAVDARADIYSLGVILYEIVTGTLPFKGANSQQVALKHVVEPPTAPSLIRPTPPLMDALIMECLEKEPARRPPTVQELWPRLEEALAELPETLDVCDGEAGASLLSTRSSGEKPLPTRVPPSLSHRTIGPASDLDARPARRSRLGVVPLVGGVVFAGGLFFFFARSKHAEPPVSPVAPLSISPSKTTPLAVGPENGAAAGTAIAAATGAGGAPVALAVSDPSLRTPGAAVQPAVPVPVPAPAAPSSPALAPPPNHDVVAKPPVHVRRPPRSQHEEDLL